MEQFFINLVQCSNFIINCFTLRKKLFYIEKLSNHTLVCSCFEDFVVRITVVQSEFNLDTWFGNYELLFFGLKSLHIFLETIITMQQFPTPTRTALHRGACGSCARAAYMSPMRYGRAPTAGRPLNFCDL